MMTEPNLVSRHKIQSCAGAIDVIATRFQHNGFYSGGFERHTILVALSGFAKTSQRRMDGRAAPRDPTRAGEYNLFPAGTLIEGRVEGTLSYLAVSIDQEFFERLMADLVVKVDVEPIIGRFDPLCAALARQIHAETMVGIPEPLLVENAASLLFLQVAAQSMRQRSDFNTRTLTRKQLAVVVEWIDANLQHSVGLSDLSSRLGFSAPYFARLFKRTTGYSPHSFILQRRLVRACSLLRDTKEPIAGIAVSVGFSSQSHFASYFKKSHGVTPAQFRRQ